MAVTSLGMGTCGLTNHVLRSSFPLGNTLRIEISTILSVVMLIPVVSRSKKQMGLVRLSCMGFILQKCKDTKLKKCTKQKTQPFLGWAFAYILINFIFPYYYPKPLNNL